MAVSPHEEKMFGLHRQLRQNQQDLQDFLSDLGNWEDEMKTKEKDLLNKKADDPTNLPPVRNSLDKKKLKKKRRKKPEQPADKKRISGFDFRAWDKFDVDKALEDIDGENKKSSSEYETDEEWEAERKKHLANEEKNTGNSHLSAGAFEVAVECYTRGIGLDPTNALLPANRALALIKMEKYAAAELDCSTAIMLDPLYVKAYLRRAAARVGLQHLAPALEDYERVLQLEPNNKQAQTEVDRLKKDIQRDKEDTRPSTTSLERSQTSEVKAVYKAPEQRSKKPLRRIEIEEIGLKEDTERKEAIARVEAKQSSAKKAMEAKDREMFEKFTVKASGDNGEAFAKDMKPVGEKASADTVRDEPQSRLENAGEGEQCLTNLKADAASKVNAQSAVSKSEKRDSSGKLLNGSSASKPSSPREGVSFIASTLERDPPQTSYQFQTDFRVLKNDLEAFYTYFMRIDPALFAKLFGKSLEASMLLKIVEAIRTYCIPAHDDCFHQLKSLAEVNRFSTTVMFFSSKEKQGIKELFQYLKAEGNHPESEVESLMKKYEV
ncbi:RNA polymerase II-associated protein 3-like [Babylonia areolata]|uniref:RNA polymerase II-associated protein 3-like n=1 Tax=Babylonia areolata TaxID=304850 RepID=UPI003FD11B2F